jgi:hypothetical protein
MLTVAFTLRLPCQSSALSIGGKQGAERSQIDVETFRLQTEMFAQLGRLLFQQHQRCADALDLFVCQITTVDPPNGQGSLSWRSNSTSVSTRPTKPRSTDSGLSADQATGEATLDAGYDDPSQLPRSR